MTTSVTADRSYDPIDISAPAFWDSTAVERERSFAELRQHRPVSWQRPLAGVLIPYPDDPGYWAVTRHADIVEVSRRSDVFVSGQGVQFENIPADIRAATESFLSMDAPQHTKLRKLVSAAFTPVQVRRLEDQIKADAKAIVEDLAAAGSGSDFVQHCARHLPLRTLSHMLGIPDEYREPVANAAEAMISAADPDFLNGRNPLEVMGQNAAYIHQVAVEMAQERRKQPQQDLMTNLVKAEVDGHRLTDEEIGAFMVLLSLAGTDTTRQTTSHALKALTDNPDQRAWLMADFEGRINPAIEEFVRWASPVMTFRRTAVADYELNGQQISAGDRVLMLYPSGNRDSEVFADPHRFDLSRDPNPHVAFGGGGAHFCLGNQVAKAQLRALFRELLHQVPDIQVGEPDYLYSSFIHGVRAMPFYLDRDAFTKRA